MKSVAPWYVYLLECRDGSLYTGITVDIERRWQQHLSGSGARYTRSHPPLRLLGYCQCEGRAEASRREYAIKQLTPARKRAHCRLWSSTAIEGRCDRAKPGETVRRVDSPID